MTMSFGNSGYSTPINNYAEEASYSHLPKPFKSTAWAQKNYTSSAARRNKNFKQVLAIEKERVEKVIRTRSETWNDQQGGAGNDAQQVAQQQVVEGIEIGAKRGLMDVDSYMSIEAAPSVRPPKKYCDITGLEAKYVDPASTLRYHNPEVYGVIKTFQPGVIQTYLTNRGQGVVLR